MCIASGPIGKIPTIWKSAHEENAQFWAEAMQSNLKTVVQFDGHRERVSDTYDWNLPVIARRSWACWWGDCWGYISGKWWILNKSTYLESATSLFCPSTRQLGQRTRLSVVESTVLWRCIASHQCILQHTAHSCTNSWLLIRSSTVTPAAAYRFTITVHVTVVQHCCVLHHRHYQQRRQH